MHLFEECVAGLLLGSIASSTPATCPELASSMTPGSPSLEHACTRQIGGQCPRPAISPSAKGMPHSAGGLKVLVWVQSERKKRRECCSMIQAPCLFALSVPLPQSGNARPPSRVKGTIPLQPLRLTPLHVTAERMLVHEVFDHGELESREPFGREEFPEGCDHRLLRPPDDRRASQCRCLQGSQGQTSSLGTPDNSPGWYARCPRVWG